MSEYELHSLLGSSIEIAKPPRRLSYDEFNELLSAVRYFEGRRVGDYRWAIHLSALLKPDALDYIRKLKELGAEGADVLDKLYDKITSILDEKSAVFVIEGNNAYLITRPMYVDIILKEMEKDQKEGGLTIYKRKYDRSKRTYVTAKYPFFKSYGIKIRFPRGLIPRVAKILEKLNIKHNYESLRYTNADTSKITVPLRDYQQIAVLDTLKQIERIGVATLMGATGSGKTEMGIALVQALMPTNEQPAIIVAPSKDLVMQWVERLTSYGITPAYITSDAENIPPNYSVLVTTYATAAKAAKELNINNVKKESEDEYSAPEEESDEEVEGVEEAVGRTEEVVKSLKNAKVLVIDEAHHVPARTVRAIASAAPNAAKIGLSATPWRNDDLDLAIYSYTGEIAGKITSSELIKRGFLVPAIIFVLKTGIKGNYGTYQEELSKVLNNDERIALTAEVVKFLPKPVMILTAFKEPGKKLAEKIRNEGLNAEFIYGELSTEERNRLLNMVRNGQLDVIIATTLADEGLDIPNLKSLVLYHGGKSRTRVYQRIGRILRPSEGKPVGIIIDLSDDTPYLKQHYEARLEMYANEPEWKVKVVANVEELIRELENLMKEYEVINKQFYSEMMKKISDLEKRGWARLEGSDVKKFVIVVPSIEVNMKQPIMKKEWSFGSLKVNAFKSVEGDQVWIIKNIGKEKKKKEPAVITN